MDGEIDPRISQGAHKPARHLSYQTKCLMTSFVTLFHKGIKNPSTYARIQTPKISILSDVQSNPILTLPIQLDSKDFSCPCLSHWFWLSVDFVIFVVT